MRGPLSFIIGVVAWAGAGLALARDIEITRACFPGFCVESREAFTTLTQDGARGRYRLLISATQSVLYVQTGPAPELPHCGPLCMVLEEQGETRVRHKHHNRLMGRLLGPYEGCGGAADYFVYLYVYFYFSEASPARLTIERDCPALTPPRSVISPPG